MIATKWYYTGLIGSLSLLAIAYFYFQQHMGLMPCPLCMFQRAALLGVAVFCLLGVVFRPKNFGAKWLAFGIVLSNLVGLLAVARQVWMQYLPAEKVPECGLGLEYMLETLPLFDVVQNVFVGSGECAEVQWRFLSLSMAEWMLGIFIIMFAISIKLLFSRKKRIFKSKYR